MTVYTDYKQANIDNNTEYRNDISPIGLDKLTIYSFHISEINWDRLANHPGSLIKPAVGDLGRMICCRNIMKIIVHTRNLRLEIGVSHRQHGELGEYENLDINPAAIIYGNNIANITSREQLLEALTIATNNLRDEFGITVDLTMAKIKRVEINRNIMLSRAFAAYAKPLDFIISALPKTLKRCQDHSDQKNSTGFKISNTDKILKCYDKEVQARESPDAGRIARFEYTLVTARKVVSDLGFDTLSGLISDFGAISSAWRKNIETDILKKVPVALLNERKRHRFKLGEAARLQQKGYINKWFGMTQTLFDVQLMREVLEEWLADKTIDNKRKRLQQFDLAAHQRTTIEPEKIFGQLCLLDELISKLRQ